MASSPSLPTSPEQAEQAEQARLEALDRYDILDTRPEESFDRVTRIARAVFDVPMVTITFIDGHRQWFKSKHGMENSETDREPALCYTTIQQGAPLVIEDTLRDPRFAENPFVTGDPHIRFYAGIPLPVAGGSIGTLCVIDTKPRRFSADQTSLLADLAHIVLTELELRAVATTDALTDTLSRRAFTNEAERTLALAIRHRTALSCIVFDLDHFKTVNDRFGHGAGDIVLKETARICRATLRKTDVFGRIGGEEFAVLLPHTARAAALGVAEKLRAALAQQAMMLPDGEQLHVTGSFGVASLDRTTPDVRSLLDHADQALYAAKNDGRNRCHEWKSPAETPDPTLRRRVLKAGMISFNLGHSTIDCTVRSLSNSGAGLDIVSTSDLPDTFKLRIESDNLSVPCRVIARKARHLGCRVRLSRRITDRTASERSRHVRPA